MSVRAPLLSARLRWFLVGCIAGLIFYSSILAAPPETVLGIRPKLIPLDKWRHFLAYAAFGYALAYATADWALETRLVAAVVIGTVVCYGVGIELGQAVTPGRKFSLYDAYANALGAVLILPWYLFRPHLEFVPAGVFVESVVARTGQS